ncbi:hypothetical protein NPIL_32041 [Nephila pilipes]|uniref:HTH psq-type domain-containing protein n=1 Tax=Nephila pilipes TaxID=299642 RepID=A0A8X6N9L7_NEPPI|nr:hypothetical protein NPIL_32041 [Nephila pilipes]
MDRKKVCEKSSAKKKMMSIELKREIIEKHEQGFRVVDLSRQYGRSTSMICTVPNSVPEHSEREEKTNMLDMFFSKRPTGKSEKM